MDSAGVVEVVLDESPEAVPDASPEVVPEEAPELAPEEAPDELLDDDSSSSPTSALCFPTHTGA